MKPSVAEAKKALAMEAIAKSLPELKEQLDRIEAKQDAILEALGNQKPANKPAKDAAK